ITPRQQELFGDTALVSRGRTYESSRKNCRSRQEVVQTSAIPQSKPPGRPAAVSGETAGLVEEQVRKPSCTENSVCVLPSHQVAEERIVFGKHDGHTLDLDSLETALGDRGIQSASAPDRTNAGSHRHGGEDARRLLRRFQGDVPAVGLARENDLLVACLTVPAGFFERALDRSVEGRGAAGLGQGVSLYARSVPTPQ